MSNLLLSVKNTILSDSFWFPQNCSWEDLTIKDQSGPYFPQFADLLVPFPLAIVFIIVRHVLEKTFAVPFAHYLGLTDRKYNGPMDKQPILEKHFRNCRKPDAKAIMVLARTSGLPERDVERWFRRRRSMSKAGVIKKFREAFWKVFYYTNIWIYGIYILYDKPWVWWPPISWVDYPTQHVTTGIYYYYMFQLAFYWSLTFTALFDVARKDFGELMFHHFITISLLSVSWVNNNVRIGTLVLISHDVNDIILECGKMLNYANFELTCTLLFVLFILSWILTRLLYFPFFVILTPFFEGQRVGNWWPAGFAYIIFLLALLGLHIFWFVLIVRIAIIKIRSTSLCGKVEDVRSDSETEDLSDSDTSQQNGKKLPVANGESSSKENAPESKKSVMLTTDPTSDRTQDQAQTYKNGLAPRAKAPNGLHN